MTLQQSRKYKVSRIVYSLHTYQFFNPQIDEYLKLSLSNGIAINADYWQLGNQYVIESGQAITNTYPVACI